MSPVGLARSAGAEDRGPCPASHCSGVSSASKAAATPSAAPSARRPETRGWHRFLEAAHDARALWPNVRRKDLAPRAGVRARGRHPSRPAIDPARLMASCQPATRESVRTARALGRPGREHIAYRRLGGGVAVNHHAPSDLRLAPAALPKVLLVDGVATPRAAGGVDMAACGAGGARGAEVAGRVGGRCRPR